MKVYTYISILLFDKFVCMYSLQLFFSPELNPDYRRSGFLTFVGYQRFTVNYLTMCLNIPLKSTRVQRNKMLKWEVGVAFTPLILDRKTLNS